MAELKMTPQFRPVGSSDETFLFELFLASREREFLPLPDELRGLVADQQYAAYRSGLGTNYPKADHFVIEVSPQAQGDSPPAPAGMILLQEGHDDLLLIDLAIHPVHRNRGLGQAVLEMMMDRCRASGKVLRGSVTPYNPARRLYARLGIVELQAEHGYIGLEWRPG